jgi:hypothetical protein
LLRTTDASVGEVIEPAAIRNLPLNGRMLIDLVLTVPGAHESHGAQTGDMNPEKSYSSRPPISAENRLRRRSTAS